MRAMAECSFDDMNGVDALCDFDYFSSDFDAADYAGDEAEPDSVWLECNGELVAATCVKVLGVHKSRGGFETLVFVCPTCGEPHESLRFR